MRREKTREEEFVEQVQRYQDQMYRFAYSIMRNDADAQDAVSESVTKAYATLHRGYDLSQFCNWFYKILRNTSLDMMRKRERYRKVYEGYEQDICAVDEASLEEKMDLWNAIFQLKEEYRTVIELAYFEDYSTKMIADSLGLKEGTVRARLSRGRDMLQKELEKGGHYE